MYIECRLALSGPFGSPGLNVARAVNRFAMEDVDLSLRPGYWDPRFKTSSTPHATLVLSPERPPAMQVRPKSEMLA